MEDLRLNQLKQLILTSKKIVGLRQVNKNLLENTIKCVIVSIDSDDFIYNTVKEKATLQNIPVYRKFKSQEIGKFCKIDVSCSVVGILS